MNAEFKSYSQAGQDRFVWEVLGGKRDGTFLDIGASHPVERSNTYGLERMGWTGVCVEADASCAKLLREQRSARIMDGDATRVPWAVELREFRMRLDYLSLDVDEASLEVLENVLASGVRFRVLTVEHDAYRFGAARRDEMVDLLKRNGYVPLCPDVCDQGLSFEVWAVSGGQGGISFEDEVRFFSKKPKEWREFFERGDQE